MIATSPTKAQQQKAQPNSPLLLNKNDLHKSAVTPSVSQSNDVQNSPSDLGMWDQSDVARMMSDVVVGSKVAVHYRPEKKIYFAKVHLQLEII